MSDSHPSAGTLQTATSSTVSSVPLDRTFSNAESGSHLTVGPSFEDNFLAESQKLTGRRRKRTAPDRGFLVYDSESEKR